VPGGLGSYLRAVCCGREIGRSATVRSQSASHIGLGVNAAVLWAVADRLAQPAAGNFTPFARTGPFAIAYAR
jgi:hypothetical protein